MTFHNALYQVRALFDDDGNRIDEAGPSIPVQVCCNLKLKNNLFNLILIMNPFYVSKNEVSYVREGKVGNRRTSLMRDVQHFYLVSYKFAKRKRRRICGDIILICP